MVRSTPLVLDRPTLAPTCERPRNRPNVVDDGDAGARWQRPDATIVNSGDDGRVHTDKTSFTCDVGNAAPGNRTGRENINRIRISYTWTEIKPKHRPMAMAAHRRLHTALQPYHHTTGRRPGDNDAAARLRYGRAGDVLRLKHLSRRLTVLARTIHIQFVSVLLEKIY